MKTNFFLLPAYAGLFILASCSHGPSAETKQKVAAFDSAWNAMGVTAKSWDDSLSKAVAFCETACKEGDAMECCEHMKAAKDSLMMPCKNDMSMFQEMQKKWDADLPQWVVLQAKLDSIKGKVAKGQGTDVEINTGIAELQTAMTAGSKELEDFIAKFNGAKTACMKNMESCKVSWAGVQCPDKKCMMHKKS